MSIAEVTEMKQYLTFKLDDELFAVGVTKIREILDYTACTKVPRTPDYMRGVINLRGSVVPVIDMRLKFGMERAKETVDTCIVVVEVAMEDEITVIGALVDSVQEVFELDAEEIEPPPKIGTKLDTNFILGMGKRYGNFIIILNVNEVFSTGELSNVKEAAMVIQEAAKEKQKSKDS